jgi:hypothetical protein
MAQCIEALIARSFCTIAGLFARQADKRLIAILQRNDHVDKAKSVVNLQEMRWTKRGRMNCLMNH